MFIKNKKEINMFDKTKINLDNLVLIESFAEGYYSNSQVCEFVFLPLELYKENEEKINSFSLVYCDLDGKHSETDADIDIYLKPKIDIVNNIIQGNYDIRQLSDCLANELGIESKLINDYTESVVEYFQNQLTEPENILLNQILKLDKNLIRDFLNNKKVVNYFLNLK